MNCRKISLILVPAISFGYGQKLNNQEQQATIYNNIEKYIAKLVLDNSHGQIPVTEADLLGLGYISEKIKAPGAEEAKKRIYIQDVPIRPVISKIHVFNHIFN